MIGVHFMADWTLGDGLYAVAFILPHPSGRAYRVRAGMVTQAMAEDSLVPMARVYDHLTENVVDAFGDERLDAAPYRAVIRQAITEVDPLP